MDAGGRFDFDLRRGGEDCFQEDDGRIYIRKCGRYLVTYTFSAPAGVSLNTTLALELDGESLFASAVNVTPGCNFYTGHALIEADAGMYVSLNTSAGVVIPSCGSDHPYVTLVIQSVD